MGWELGMLNTCYFQSAYDFQVCFYINELVGGRSSRYRLSIVFLCCENSKTLKEER